MGRNAQDRGFGRALESEGQVVDPLRIGKHDLTTPAQAIPRLSVRPPQESTLLAAYRRHVRRGLGDRIAVATERVETPFIGRPTPVRSKRSTDRLVNRADLETLGELDP